MVTLPPVLVAQIYPASISMVSSTLGAVLYDALSSSWGTLQTLVRWRLHCVLCSTAAHTENAVLTRHTPAGLLLQRHRCLPEVSCSRR